jgi:hypothetical protein
MAETTTRTLARRAFLARSATATAAILVLPGAILHTTEAWGLETRALAPETMRTLVRLARDIYPHDRLADRFYAIAVKGFDEKAAADPATMAAIEAGVAALDARAQALQGSGYADIAWERDRVDLLRQIEGEPFFQEVRSALVVSLYNQKEVWPLFGYEGESASQGGYIDRGFDDIDWL